MIGSWIISIQINAADIYLQKLFFIYSILGMEDIGLVFVYVQHEEGRSLFVDDVKLQGWRDWMVSSN